MTVRIGIAAPLSARGAALGREMANAATLAVNEINAALGARTFEAIIVDDKGTEDGGRKAAQRMIEDSDIAAVIGHYNGNATLAACPAYREAGLALVAPIVSNPRLTRSGWGNVFRFTNHDEATGDAIAAHMIDTLGKRRVVIVASRSTCGESMSAQFARAFVRRGGALLEHIRVDEGETRFDNLARELASRCDCLFYGGTYEGAPLLRALRDRARNQLVATGDGCWDIGNFLEPAGEIAESGEGVLVLSACPELGRVRGSTAFAERYAANFGSLKNYAIHAYEAAMLTLQAIEAARGRNETPQRARVVEALRSARRRGIAYPDEVSFDSDGDNNAAMTALHVVEKGRFRQVAMTRRH